jgi:UPF0176 protein
MPITISSFYKFTPINDPHALRATLLAALSRYALRGTILLAHEGINGTLSGAPENMAAFLALLRSDPRFFDLATKDATADEHPFRRSMVKVKREIIRFDTPAADPTVQVGTYVAPEDWNALISDPGVLVLDTRNAYEVELGTFANAVDPKTKRFRDLPHYVQANLDPAQHRKVAMFCTGGIRCEKASSYLKVLGFAEVYHLKGGILSYLATVPEAESLWRGKCYVFDEREAVGTGD